MGRTPYSRGEFNRALIVNALLSPFNVLILTVMLIAGIVLGVFAPMLPIAAAVYGLAAARTYFDEGEANKVLERERARRREALDRGRVDPEQLALPIRRLLEGAHQRERRIRDAVERAELPYEEVSAEVDRFVRTMEDSARRAELLYEALSECDVETVERRLATAERSPDQAELAKALRSQLEVIARMETQLQRFYDAMERILVELDTVRGNLVSVSASTDSANQGRLADDVRSLREQVSSVAEGMSEAYEPPTLPAS